MGLAAHVDLHHGLDIVSRQLTGLDDPNSNLRDKLKHRINTLM